jgi:hypothetical protein
MPDADEAALAESASVIEEARGEYSVVENIPPPPEEPPDEFVVAHSSQPLVASHQPMAAQLPSAVGGWQAVVNDRPPAIVAEANTRSEANATLIAPKAKGGNGEVVQPVVAPAPVLRSQAPKHLRIFLKRTQNHEEDVRRMRELLMLLSSVEGRDRFTFYVPNPQGIVQLDFPNHSTSYAQVQDALKELMGEWGTLEVQ